jgi:hypothetical protein
MFRRRLFALTASLGCTLVGVWYGYGALIELQREPLHEALRQAAERADLRAVETLRARGARIDAADRQGRTAVMRAAMAGRASTLRILLRAGGSPHGVERSTGNTPLIWAVLTGNPVSVKALLACGARPNVKNRAGETALTLALRREVGSEEALSQCRVHEACDSPTMHRELLYNLRRSTTIVRALRAAGATQ